MTIGWGILGTGSISASFAEGLAYAPGAKITAVASRDAARAEAFRARFGAERAHVEVEALANDPAVDVVYIGTPHVRHAPDALACIERGKAVLIEKPLGVDAEQARRVLARAAEKNVFAMEAMWTRFFPAMDELLGKIASGAIGAAHLVQADFGFVGDPSSEPRLFDPAFAGGALLDVGVYAVWLAIEILGAPLDVAAVGHVGSTGVEERAAIAMRHAGGALSTLSCAITTETASAASIFGASGALSIHAPWWRPSGYGIHREAPVPRPYLGNGYAHEAIEVMRCMKAGERESPRLTHAKTLAVLDAIGRARALLRLPLPSSGVRG